MSWKWFNREDFACKCGCKQNYIEDSFVDKLDRIREDSKIVLPVSSGYRCPSHNAKVSTTGLTGPHTTGHAADLLVSRGNAYKLVTLAESYGFTGIGVKQHGDVRFIHLDDLTTKEGPRPTIWSY